ncbi:uncharacterized protein LOC111001673 [Pieris rapae]|uniref:uncharacterized protein LOC111001673 n=1 Tax=Pieris rapae TaxID=64459 RepID=UPI001E27C398|nr:uncharacterized protein LOC111001673 [Pieris rapae]
MKGLFNMHILICLSYLICCFAAPEFSFKKIRSVPTLNIKSDDSLLLSNFENIGKDPTLTNDTESFTTEDYENTEITTGETEMDDTTTPSYETESTESTTESHLLFQPFNENIQDSINSPDLLASLIG